MSTMNFGASIAAAAAALALSGSVFAADAPAGSKGMAIGASDKVHCYGLHACKGNSDCATAEHSCKGQNACAGHGFKAIEAGACLAKGGVIADLKAK